MKNRCFEEVDGFEELTKNNDIKICFLNPNQKSPESLTEYYANLFCDDFLCDQDVGSFDELDVTREDFLKTINGKFNYRTVEEANMNPNTNLGFVLPHDYERNEEFWVAIDVDGQDDGYMINNNPELKKGLRKFLFDCISNGLKKRNINFVAVSTVNNGFHIYFKTTQAHGKDHIPGVMNYPNSQILIKKSSPKIFDDYPVLESILDYKMGTRAIEIFTQSKMVVAPGSIIDGKKYGLIASGVSSFHDVSVYREGPVEDLIIDILQNDCYFFYKPPIENSKEMNQVFEISDDKQNLSDTNIKNIGDFIIYAFQHISGQKHYATLALGGFLYSQNISQSSIVRIGEYIVDNAPENLFKGSKEHERSNGFIKVLVHDSSENQEKKKTGLTTLKEMFRGTEVSIMDLTKVLWNNSSPKFHTFQPNGINADTYQEVTVDYEKKETRWYSLKSSTDEEGNPLPPKKMQSHLIRHVLTDINYIDDISTAAISRVEKMPISFYIQSRLRPSMLYICGNTQEMIDNYNSLPLAHQRGSNNILALVIDEYESIGLIGTIERSTIPGIYLSRDKTDLRRFIQYKGEVIEQKPKLPDKNKLSNALNLLKEINDVYPWYNDKFATFAKLGMILPYGYVFKSEYGSFIRGIILYGEGGTCKSSASELIVKMNVPQQSIEEKEIDYIMPGSEFSTVYRMGAALHKHSYPIMIEEVESVFEDSDNRDLIKNSITRKFIRNPGGEKEYYSRAIPVFSANELSDEIEKSGMFRRFLILNFVNGERGDTPEVEEALSFLNKNGVRNSRFKELYVISEFIFYDLHNHLEYFSYTPQQIIDTVLKDMSDYTDVDLSWLIEPNFDKYYQTDRYEEDQADLSMVLDTLKYYYKNSIKLSGVASNVSEQFLENLIEDKYPYIYRIKNRQNNGVLITSDFNKSYKKSYPDAKKLSLDRLAELLNNGLNLNFEVEKRRLVPTNLKARITGLYVNWGDFCNIFNIKIDKEEE